MSIKSTTLAIVISPDGEIDSVTLALDDESRLRELQSLVGGYIEAVSLPDDCFMALNENGKDGQHIVNHTATAIAHEAEAIMPSDYIAGVAVIVPEQVVQ
ncbi:MAG: DUF3846 domain-containing protein [Betaproteobacteria bacterium]|nr:DUF3846 domain-containing protein [Betaproteobacteria bacterium]